MSQIQPVGIERDVLEVANYIRPVLKTLIIGALIFFAVLIFSGSLLRASTIAFASLILSCFATWRRYLEPLSFFAFAAAVIFWCHPDVITSAKATLLESTLCKS